MMKMDGSVLPEGNIHLGDVLEPIDVQESRKNLSATGGGGLVEFCAFKKGTILFQSWPLSGNLKIG